MVNNLTSKKQFSGSAPMLILGPVIFHLKTTPYQSFQRTTSFNWATLQRLNAGSMPLSKNINASGPAAQFISLGEDKIHLEGIIYLQIAESVYYLSFMRYVAGLGIPLPLLGCDGSILGLWLIERIEQKESFFAARGAAQKIEFSLDIKRYYTENKIMNRLGLI